MYTLPAGMAEQLGQSHQTRVYASLYQRPWPPTGGSSTPWAWLGTELLPISPLPVESGTLTIDNTGVQRRRATVTVAPLRPPSAGYVPVYPTSVASQLTPFRNMVVLYYATAPLDGTLPPPPQGFSPTASADVFTLGVFVLTDVAVSLQKNGDIKLTLELQDMSQDVSRRVLLKPYVTQNGVSMTSAIEAIINEAFSTGGLRLPAFSADYSGALTSGGEGPDVLYAAGYTWDEGQDPWEAAQQMAEAIGYQLYFGPAGACLASPIPNPATTPVCWQYATGYAPTKATGGFPNLTSVKRPFSQSQVFNYVEMVVEGANANPSPDLLYVGTSFLAQIGDTDPSSPTNIHGPYGIAGDVQYDQINYQQSVAQFAAKARLRRDLGAADMVTFTALPNPAHEAYDVVSLTAPEIGLAQNYVIDTVELPLNAGQDMTVTARRVVNVP